jgi:hypothetical protein
MSSMVSSACKVIVLEGMALQCCRADVKFRYFLMDSFNGLAKNAVQRTPVSSSVASGQEE